LREQVDRGLTSAAFKSKMKSRRDSIERDGEGLAPSSEAAAALSKSSAAVKYSPRLNSSIAASR
jgi:hypothetical protein